MISVHTQITVRCLRDQGKSIKQIARDMGLSRNTVRRYLRDRSAADYPVRKAAPNAGLEPFAGDIELMLAQELIGSRIPHRAAQTWLSGAAAHLLPLPVKA